MWHAQLETAPNGRTIKLVVQTEAGPLRFGEFVAQLRDAPEFRTFFTAQLAAMPFKAFRWETPPVTTATIDRTFECVVIDSPRLTDSPDTTTFAQFFRAAPGEEVVVFPSLGKDALLVVPCPRGSSSAYAHLAAFLRSAPIAQCQSLWQTVGRTMLESVSTKQLWLNTAGGGVAWLHVRLDSTPKYYVHGPYKS